MSWIKCSLYGGKVATVSKKDCGAKNAHAPEPIQKAATTQAIPRLTEAMAATVMSLSMDDTKLRHVARRLRDLVEPLAASVYFAPEVHSRYEKLGFGPGLPSKRGIQYPDLPAYFTSRGACIGTVPGEVVTAAFGVFPAHVVVPAVTQGWETTTRDEILAARLEGQIEALRNVLGDEPEGADRATELLRRMAEAGFAGGHHIYAGLSSLPWPADPMGALFRAADLVREHRGDSHIAAWTAAGLDPIEICLMSDAWMDQPLKAITRTRGWTDEEMEAGIELLVRPSAGPDP